MNKIISEQTSDFIIFFARDIDTKKISKALIHELFQGNVYTNLKIIHEIKEEFEQFNGSTFEFNPRHMGMDIFFTFHQGYWEGYIDMVTPSDTELEFTYHHGYKPL